MVHKMRITPVCSISISELSAIINYMNAVKMWWSKLLFFLKKKFSFIKNTIQQITSMIHLFKNVIVKYFKDFIDIIYKLRYNCVYEVMKFVTHMHII